MPPSLKITNCYNITLYDSTWNPGEDFEYRDYESDYSGSNTEDESYPLEEVEPALPSLLNLNHEF